MIKENILTKGLKAVVRGVKRVLSWYVHLFKGRPWYIKILSGTVSFVLFFILYLGAVDINLFGLFGMSPSMDAIKSTRPAQASEIYSDDGVMIGKIFSTATSLSAAKV